MNYALTFEQAGIFWLDRSYDETRQSWGRAKRMCPGCGDPIYKGTRRVCGATCGRMKRDLGPLGR